MEKKLILKVKLNKEDQDWWIVEASDCKCQVCNTNDNVLVNLLYLMDVDEQEVEKLQKTTTLSNLFELIQKGFTIRIDETEDNLRFITYKGQASTSCGVSKEIGIAWLLKNAEDFAEEFLEDLKSNTACGI